MTWENILKAPWVQDIDPAAHTSPRIGRYIKYLENLLDENHRYGFKRWWSMGRIKTVAREEGRGFDYSKEPDQTEYEGKPEGSYSEYTRDLPSLT